MTEQIEYRGFNINIHPDNDGQNPRTDWDCNLGTMICWRRNYNLGDKHDFNGPNEFIYDLAVEIGCNEDVADEYYTEYPEAEFINKYLDKIDKKCIILPLYLYDHSGITINTHGFSCPWDSGQIGWIYVTYKKIRREYGWKLITKNRREKIVEYLRNEVKTYDQFLTGEVYGYIIEPTDKNKNIECDDACWGFFGYDHEKSGLLDHAKPSIDYAIKEYKEKVVKNKNRKVNINNFMKTCWAY